MISLAAITNNQKHAPLRLPDDMKRFYSISNGLSVKWSSTLRGNIPSWCHLDHSPTPDLTVALYAG